MRIADLAHPLGIAMWDFSWLERSYAGGGFEDTGSALDALLERGYRAVRIDAYPHLVAAGDSSYRLRPIWTEHPWGSPMSVDVTPTPALVDFVTKARDREILVGLSSWFRQDDTDARMRLSTPAALAAVWIETLRVLEGADLLDCILYVDLANEFPIPKYQPFLYPPGYAGPAVSRATPRLLDWMATSIQQIRDQYPDLDYCYSFVSSDDPSERHDVSEFDLLELHIWMTMAGDRAFYERIDYDITAYLNDPAGYELLADHAEATYRSDPEAWQRLLFAAIDEAASWSRAADLPLATTESWGIVTWKDGPRLDWGWVKELCAIGTRAACSTGRWALISTSNFCSPQFLGMWRDVDWHRELCAEIESAQLPRKVA